MKAARLGHLRSIVLGLLLAAPPSVSFAQGMKVEYAHLDALGNVIAVSDSSGVEIESHDYLPFGDEWCGTSVCATVKPGQSRRLTGKERDTETALDYYGARYYRANVGRLTTIDPVYTWEENLVDPHRWNRYAYARNNPLKCVDPDGRVIETAWDVANIGIGVASFRSNVREGNWGSALLDVLGIVGDTASAAAPEIPGGFGAGIKAVRTADKIRDGVRAGDKAVDVARASRSAAKSIRSVEQNIVEHRDKIAAYLKNPDAFDDKGFLRNAPTAEIREEDFYWDVPPEARYQPYSEPAPGSLNLGQLSHDWEEVLRILDGRSEPKGYALVRLSTVLRRIGEKVPE